MIDSIIAFYTQNPEQLTLQVVLFIFALLFWRRIKTMSDHLIVAKDREIERLAEDNRRYREIYLTHVKGLTKDQYNKISAVSVDDDETSV